MNTADDDDDDDNALALCKQRITMVGTGVGIREIVYYGARLWDDSGTATPTPFTYVGNITP